MWGLACSVCHEFLLDENGKQVLRPSRPELNGLAMAAGWEVDDSANDPRHHEHVCPKHLYRRQAA